MFAKFPSEAGGGLQVLTIALLCVQIAKSLHECDFEKDMCGWATMTRKPVDLTWIRGANGDVANGTGPPSDAQGSGSGHYALLPFPQNTPYIYHVRDKSAFVSPSINGFLPSPACRFKYSFILSSSSRSYCYDRANDCYQRAMAKYADVPTYCRRERTFAENYCAVTCDIFCYKLNLYVTNTTMSWGTPKVLAPHQQTDTWREYEEDVSRFSGQPFWIKFELITGKDHSAFAALDGFQFIGCATPTTVVIHQPTKTVIATTTHSPTTPTTQPTSSKAMTTQTKTTATATTTRRTTNAATTAKPLPPSLAKPSGIGLNPGLIIGQQSSVTPPTQSAKSLSQNENGYYPADATWAFIVSGPAILLSIVAVLVVVAQYMRSRHENPAAMGNPKAHPTQRKISRAPILPLEGISEA